MMSDVRVVDTSLSLIGLVLYQSEKGEAFLLKPHIFSVITHLSLCAWYSPESSVSSPSNASLLWSLSSYLLPAWSLLWPYAHGTFPLSESWVTHAFDFKDSVRWCVNRVQKFPISCWRVFSHSILASDTISKPIKWAFRAPLFFQYLYTFPSGL